MNRSVWAFVVVLGSIGFLFTLLAGSAIGVDLRGSRAVRVETQKNIRQNSQQKQEENPDMKGHEGIPPNSQGSGSR